MQFCDFTNAKALKYWENCTDGHHEGYEAVKKKIRNYKKGIKYYLLIIK